MTGMGKLSRAAVAAAGIALAVSLAGCGGSHHPDAKTCKAAMKHDYAAALASGRTAREPAACKGLSQAELSKLAGQVMTGS